MLVPATAPSRSLSRTVFVACLVLGLLVAAWPRPAAADFGGQVIHVTVVIVGAKSPQTSVDVSLQCSPPLVFPPPMLRFWSPGDQDLNGEGMQSCALVVPPPQDALGVSVRCDASGGVQCTSDRSATGGGQFRVVFTVTATFPTTTIPTTAAPLPPAVPVPTETPGGVPGPVTVPEAPNPTNPPMPSVPSPADPNAPSTTATSVVSTTTPGTIVEIGAAPGAPTTAPGTGAGRPDAGRGAGGIGSSDETASAIVVTGSSGAPWARLLFAVVVVVATAAAAAAVFRRRTAGVPAADEPPVVAPDPPAS